MAVVRTQIEHNLLEVRRRIKQTAERVGRSPESVRIVAVTKTVGVDEAGALLELGLTDLGENRVENARGKIESLGHRAQWHMIGPVQRRKASEVAALFDVVDSVDRIEVAEALERRCEELEKPLEVLIEVNVAGEASKHGFAPQDASGAVTAISRLRHLRAVGLMTMAPFEADPEAVRPVFARLRRLAEEVGLPELSMGMSNDFEVAIEEGATQVRIGTALFVE